MRSGTSRPDPYRLTKRAQADVDDIAIHIAHERGIAAATRMVERLDRAFLMLSDHPYSERSRQHDLRRSRQSIAVAGYVIVYRVMRSGSVVSRIIDGRRDCPRLFDP